MEHNHPRMAKKNVNVLFVPAEVPRELPPKPGRPKTYAVRGIAQSDAGKYYYDVLYLSGEHADVVNAAVMDGKDLPSFSLGYSIDGEGIKRDIKHLTTSPVKPSVLSEA